MHAACRLSCGKESGDAGPAVAVDPDSAIACMGEERDAEALVERMAKALFEPGEVGAVELGQGVGQILMPMLDLR